MATIRRERDIVQIIGDHEASIKRLKATLARVSVSDLGALTDVTITSVTDNEVIAYDTGTGEWINQTAAEAGLATSGHGHDHGGFSGLGDDDHTLYVLASGARNITGDQTFLADILLSSSASVIRANAESGRVLIQGGATGGGNIEIYGGSHASLPSHIYYDGAEHNFRTVGGVVRFHIDSDDDIEIRDSLGAVAMRWNDGLASFFTQADFHPWAPGLYDLGSTSWYWADIVAQRVLDEAGVERLDLNGDWTSAGDVTAVAFNLAGVDAWSIDDATDDDFKIKEGGTVRFRIADDGNAIRFYDSGGAEFFEFNDLTTAYDIYFGGTSTAFIRYNSSTTKMEINEGGNALAWDGGYGTYGALLIGDTTPEAAFDIWSGSGAGFFQGYRATTTTTQPMMSHFSDVGGTANEKWRTEADGDTLSDTGAYGTLSDERWKESVLPARDYLADLRNVDVVKYRLKGVASEYLGFSAQQLETVFPGMVKDTHKVLRGLPDPDDPEKRSRVREEIPTKYVKTTVFIPMLVSAVQELADRLEALEAA